MKDKTHMQMLREMLAKEEAAEGEEGIIRLRSKAGDFTVGNELVGAYGPVFFEAKTADTLEHAIEQAYAALVGKGE